MTKLLEQAVETARTLSPSMQDELATLILQFAGHEQPVYELSEVEAKSLEKSLGQAARREFATDEQVRAVWAKHGL